MASVKPMALNTPQTAVAANPSLPVHTIPAGVSATLPQGGTIQVHPNIPGGFMHVTTSGQGNGGSGGSMAPANQPGNKFPYAPNAVHQYDIVVTRLTYTIAGALPFVIGLGDEFGNQFSDFLGQIPGMATNTPAAVTTVAGGILDFSYTVSGATDHVQISCPQTPYTRLLKLWEIHRFTVTQARISISDTTAQSQFNTSIKTGKIDQDSDTSVRPLSYVANDSPYQYNSAKIDLARTIYLSKVEGILSGIINDSMNNFSTTFSLFITDSAPTFTAVGTSPAVAGASI